MTESEWLTCTDPKAMLVSLARTATDRKLRLFEVSCCRRIWSLIAHDGYRDIVEAAERYADGHLDRDGLRATERSAYDRSGAQDGDPALWAATHAASEFIEDMPLLDGDDVSYNQAALATGQASGMFEATYHAERFVQCDLLRCIFGNPLRPAAIDPAWLTLGVRALAQPIYDGRAFDGMPVLGDALNEAGCDDVDILSHCRGPGPHARGCWVIDLVLGRS